MKRENKKNRAFVKCMAATLALASLMGSAAACTTTVAVEDNSDKIVIRVANFGGGIGREWLDEAAERFKEEVKDKEYATGKKGVTFEVTNAIGTTCVGMKTSGTHIFFLQDKYSECFGEIQKGSALDITDIVSEETLAEFGESGKIEDKLDKDYRFALKGNDGKYYMLPHYEIQSGASYDVDLFEKEEFYLAEGTNGSPFNCSLTGKIVYFTGDADEKTVGNDGVKGTDDDGMPTTLNELVAMCDHMMDEGVVPFSVAGSHIDYTNYFIDGLWTALAGYEQRNAVVAHTGKVEYVTGLSDNELWAGSDIYAPVTETVTLTGSKDGYMAVNQAARYYAYAFIELAYQQEWFYDRYDEANYTHKEAMRAFILNDLQGMDKIGSHIEGSYWYNEAEGYNLFNDYKSFSGTGTNIKNIAHWHMPTSYGNDVVTGEENKREQAIINGCTSTAMINGNLDDNPGNEGLIRACKDFLKFLSTEKELKNFTACTGVSKALYSYTIDESVLADLDPYQKTIMRLRANNRSVNQYGDNETYRAKSGYMTYSISAVGFHPTFDGVEYYSPLEAYYKKKKNAWECFEATGYSETKWTKEIYAGN
jgi:ABC-type glycerol-3-phosphate transport system substrate-binding protein